MEDKYTVLVVDDSPDNLALLNELLKNEYNVKIANSGKTALQIVANLPQPDLVLLDIMMPEMDGYSVCQKMKENETTRNIPVIFISALSETFDIVKAFQSGGADYIFKPFQAAEVQARVKTHLDLHRSRQELQILLSKTLIGSVRMMIDLLALSQPLLRAQSGRVRLYAQKLIQILKIHPNEAWNIELAILLAPVGCMGVSRDVLIRRDTSQKLSFDEMQQLDKFPEIGAAMVGRIPRLEKVAAMIRNQSIPIRQLIGAENDIIYIGSAILHMLLAFDSLVTLGKEPADAVNILAAQFYPVSILEGLRMIVNSDNCLTPSQLTFGLLQPGMVLAEDLLGNDGSIVLGKGSELSASLIQLLHNFAAQGYCHMTKVLVWDTINIDPDMTVPQNGNVEEYIVRSGVGD
jgi:CheY-like chemotaxis protein